MPVIISCNTRLNQTGWLLYMTAKDGKFTTFPLTRKTDTTLVLRRSGFYLKKASECTHYCTRQLICLQLLFTPHKQRLRSCLKIEMLWIRGLEAHTHRAWAVIMERCGSVHETRYAEICLYAVCERFRGQTLPVRAVRSLYMCKRDANGGKEKNM